MSDLEITRGTTNVFADLGYPDAAERQTKTRLAFAVNELLKSRKLKQREIARKADGIPHRIESRCRNHDLSSQQYKRDWTDFCTGGSIKVIAATAIHLVKLH